MNRHCSRDGGTRKNRYARPFLFALGLLLGLAACLREQPDSRQEPLAAFDIGNNRGKAPLSVVFKNHSIPGSEPIQHWEWDFGDGHRSSEAEPSHRFERPGLYTVALTVRNALGESQQVWESAVEVLPADVAVTIRAFDSKGRQLDKLVAVSENLQIEEQNRLPDNRLALHLRPSEAGGLLRLRRNGYLDGVLFINRLSDAADYSVVLQRNPAVTPAPNLAAR